MLRPTNLCQKNVFLIRQTMTNRQILPMIAQKLEHWIHRHQSEWHTSIGNQRSIRWSMKRLRCHHFVALLVNAGWKFHWFRGSNSLISGQKITHCCMQSPEWSAPFRRRVSVWRMLDAVNRLRSCSTPSPALSTTIKKAFSIANRWNSGRNRCNNANHRAASTCPPAVQRGSIPFHNHSLLSLPCSALFNSSAPSALHFWALNLLPIWTQL